MIGSHQKLMVAALRSASATRKSVLDAMSNPDQPVVAIVGNTTTANDAAAAAEEIGRALAKAGFRIVVYGSDPAYLEAAVVKGYASAQTGAPGAIRVT